MERWKDSMCRSVAQTIWKCRNGWTALLQPMCWQAGLTLIPCKECLGVVHFSMQQIISNVQDFHGLFVLLVDFSWEKCRLLWRPWHCLLVGPLCIEGSLPQPYDTSEHSWQLPHHKNPHWAVIWQFPHHKNPHRVTWFIDVYLWYWLPWRSHIRCIPSVFSQQRTSLRAGIQSPGGYLCRCLIDDVAEKQLPIWLACALCFEFQPNKFTISSTFTHCWIWQRRKTGALWLQIWLLTDNSCPCRRRC